MFDIGFFELLLIATVGLVVIGPERLPETVRTVSLGVGRIRRSVRNTINNLEEQVGADEIRRQLHNEEVMHSLSSTQNEINHVLNEGPGADSVSHQSDVSSKC